MGLGSPEGLAEPDLYGDRQRHHAAFDFADRATSRFCCGPVVITPAG
jgi:hypothetical protein